MHPPHEPKGNILRLRPGARPRVAATRPPGHHNPKIPLRLGPAMRPLSLLVALASLLVLLAGCLTPDRPDDEPPADPMEGYTCVDDPMPVGEGHVHSDGTAHRFACNAVVLAHASLREFGGEDAAVGAHAAAIHGGTLAVAVNGEGADGGQSQNGFHLFDVSGTAGTGGRADRLVHLGFWDAGEAVNGDRTIAFSPDGATVFLGFEDGASPGVVAVDVTDPASPVEVARWDDPSGYGPHTVAAGDVGGGTYVFLLSLGVQILEFTEAGFTPVSRYVTQDELSVLDAIGMLNASGGDPTDRASTYAVRSLYGHDMVLFNDEVTGRSLLLVAYAYDGAKIVDVTDPRVPLLLASWVPPPDTAHKHYTHSMAAERLEDGTLLVVVGSETFEPENQGIASPVWILDGTAAAEAAPGQGELELLGTWRNPGGAPAGSLGLSVHFFRLKEGLMYLSHYHGGVWAMDLRTPEARAAPTAFGYVLPVPAEPVVPPEGCCFSFELDGVPMVFDVEVGDDHTVYGADLHQGVWAIAFGPPPA